MDFEYIKDRLTRVLALVEDCRAGGVSEMERDLILSELRDVYAAVRFDARPDAEASETTVAPVVFPVAVPAEEPQPAPKPEEPVTEAVPVAEPVEESVPVAEAEAAPAPEPEIECEPAAAEPEQEAAAEPEPKSEESFDDVEALLQNEEPAAETQRRRMIVRSLYGDDFAEPAPTQESHTEPQTAAAEAPEVETPVATEAPAETETIVEPEPEKPAVEEAQSEPEIKPEPEKPAAPATEKPQTTAQAHTVYAAAPHSEHSAEHVLGEVINSGVQTLADTLPATENRADAISHVAIDDIKSAIGMNDRFMLIRELFAGDVAAFEECIARLNSFGSLEDCMVHIIENYAWNPDSDGAKLMMSLVERRYGNR